MAYHFKNMSEEGASSAQLTSGCVFGGMWAQQKLSDGTQTEKIKNQCYKATKCLGKIIKHDMKMLGVLSNLT